MQAIVTTSKGAEHISALEIKELVKATKIKKQESVVKFVIKDMLDLCTICYKAQSINRALLLLSEFEVEKTLEKTFDNLKKSFDKTNIKEWLLKSYKVESERHGKHDFKSVEISAQTTKLLFNKKLKIDYENPDVIFFIYIYNDKGFFGVDFAGMELAKRQYKIFNHPESLKGITGYVVARESGFSGKEILIDPFMGSGVIAIEAALYAQGFPVRYYDKDKLAFTKFEFFKDKFFEKHDDKKEKIKVYGYDSQLRYLKAVQKNAKLAGADINLSKKDIEWLDTKFEKNSVDIIATDPPRMSKHKDIPKLKKTFNELFYQADYVLKKKGIITLITKDYVLLEECAKNHKFNITNNYLFYQGQEEFNILTFTRG